MNTNTLATWRRSLACALLAGMASASLADEPWAAAEMSPAALQAQAAADAASLVILDVRTAEEFATGHIPGAINIPVDQIGARLAELEASKGKTIVTYCRSGRRAATALATLHAAGFEKLAHLTGDMPGWTAATEKPAAEGK
jgi:rhodanese-related sulfurtransferase